MAAVIVPGAAGIEDIFYFIEQDHHVPVREDILRSLEGAQALRAHARVAVLVFTGHLEQFTAGLCSQDFSQLSFTGAGFAVKKNVHPFASGGERALEIRPQGAEFAFQVGEIINAEVRRRTWRDDVPQQDDRVGIQGHHVFGKTGRQ